MDIALNHLLPIPLRDTLKDLPSDIWNKDIVCLPGEHIHVRAPSGSGKTTLIHFLFRLRQDYEGSILIGGKDLRVTDLISLARIRREGLSIVFQDLRLFGQLTARENLEIKRVLTASGPDDRIENYAGRLGLTTLLDEPAWRLSYGEQQRVAILRALLQPFNWILLDEPFSHLDRANISSSASLIQEVCQNQHAGILLVDLEDDDHFDYTRKMKL